MLAPCTSRKFDVFAFVWKKQSLGPSSPTQPLAYEIWDTYLTPILHVGFNQIASKAYSEL